MSTTLTNVNGFLNIPKDFEFNPENHDIDITVSISNRPESQGYKNFNVVTKIDGKNVRGYNVECPGASCFAPKDDNPLYKYSISINSNNNPGFMELRRHLEEIKGQKFKDLNTKYTEEGQKEFRNAVFLKEDTGILYESINVDDFNGFIVPPFKKIVGTDDKGPYVTSNNELSSADLMKYNYKQDEYNEKHKKYEIYFVNRNYKTSNIHKNISDIDEIPEGWRYQPLMRSNILDSLSSYSVNKICFTQSAIRAQYSGRHGPKSATYLSHVIVGKKISLNEITDNIMENDINSSITDQLNSISRKNDAEKEEKTPEIKEEKEEKGEKEEGNLDIDY